MNQCPWADVGYPLWTGTTVASKTDGKYRSVFIPIPELGITMSQDAINAKEAISEDFRLIRQELKKRKKKLAKFSQPSAEEVNDWKSQDMYVDTDSVVLINP